MRVLRVIVLTVCASTIGLLPASGATPLTDLMKPGDVIEGHAEFESECASCHQKFSKDSQSRLCLDCHEDIAHDVENASGYHGRASEVTVSECRDCHTDHEGRGANIAAFDHDTFEHSLTDFPLLGAHSGGECADCHAEGRKFREAPSECVACHRDDDNHNGELGEDCAQCHTQRDWKEAKFDHSETGWPLEGKHADAECESCHVGGTYQDTTADCASCHRDDDDHAGQFGLDCATCHVPEAWTVSVFDHYRETGYALEGGHRQVACTSCHTGPLYTEPLDQACQSCHLEDDVHDGLRGRDCAACHDVSGWERDRFDHGDFTGFALRGKHDELECENCHLEPADRVTLPTACFDCHRDDDPHKGQEGERCANCHNEGGWDIDVAFDHDLTSFPLLGRHAEQECDQCHASKAFRDAETACFACHAEDDYHDGSLGEACADCHMPFDWTVWEFDHESATGFGLTGAHASVDCAACHRDGAGGRIKAPSTMCGDCHRQDDIHLGEFGRRCERCHITESFAEIIDPR